MEHDQTRSVRPRWRPPDHRVRVCTLTSCQPDGGRELMQALEERLGIKVDERTPDGRISLEALECVGLCEILQSANIDDEPVMGLEAVLRFVDGLLAEGSPATASSGLSESG